MPQRITAKVAEIEKYKDDLIRVRFGLPDPLQFEAGQFMSIAVKGHLRRSYSVGNPPFKNDYLETYVDCSPGGPGSEYFQDLKEGDEADIMAPLGRFIYQPRHLPVMFFATGTGIVPFLSMIEQELKREQSNRDITLFYGVRTEDRIMVERQLDEWVEVNENFQYHLYVSQPKSEQGWQGNVGRFTQAIPDIDFSGVEIYICGGGEMISEVERMALHQGADRDRIYYERFY